VQQNVDTGGLDAELTGVHAVSANDVWAVGNTFTPNSNTQQPVILHWNGSAWSRVPLPRVGRPSDDVRLSSVAGDFRADAWAVGTILRDNANQSFVLHWNGTRWSLAPLPALGRDTGLLGVSASSPFNAWAVGFTGSSPAQTLTLHWNGRRWTRIPSPDPAGPANEAFLHGVVTTSEFGAFAVGRFTSGNQADALLLRWTGFRWVQVPTANPGTVNELFAVDSNSPQEALAVGSVTPSRGAVQAFAVRCC
jgi:hypothetical protein